MIPSWTTTNSRGGRYKRYRTYTGVNLPDSVALFDCTALTGRALTVTTLVGGSSALIGASSAGKKKKIHAGFSLRQLIVWTA